MKRVLSIQPQKCTGCRFCEIACSFAHEGNFNPSKSRIQVMKWEEDAIDVPMTCQQCDDAPCEFICPANAFYRDQNTGALLINQDLCIGCRMCMSVCPFGAIRCYDDEMVKCDLCDGDPACVKFCESKAIEYTIPNKASIARGREAAWMVDRSLKKEIL